MTKMTGQENRARAQGWQVVHDEWHDHLLTLPPQERAEWARKFGQINAAYRNPNTTDEEKQAATEEVFDLEPGAWDWIGIG